MRQKIIAGVFFGVDCMIDHRTIFLHIGINKTGTTAIQRYLSGHQNLLKSLGLLYPQTGLRGESHYGLSDTLGFHHKIISKDEAIELSCLREQFNKEISNYAGMVLFSSEFFVLNKPIEKAKHFFDGYPVKIVVYLRRHDHWWESVYAQAVKTVARPPWNRGIMGFVNFNRKKNKIVGKYRHLLDRWAEQFGKENILVRPYELEQNHPNLVFDLLRTIGMAHLLNELPSDIPRENTSSSTRSIQLLDIFQRLRVKEDVRLRLIKYAMVLPSDECKQKLLSPEQRRKLIEEHLNDYEYIAREYMGRENGQLFTEPLPELDHEWQAPPHPTPMEVAETVITALTAAESNDIKGMQNCLKFFL
jgi:hypothetical protein